METGWGKTKELKARSKTRRGKLLVAINNAISNGLQPVAGFLCENRLSARFPLALIRRRTKSRKMKLKTAAVIKKRR